MGKLKWKKYIGGICGVVIMIGIFCSPANAEKIARTDIQNEEKESVVELKGADKTVNQKYEMSRSKLLYDSKAELCAVGLLLVCAVCVTYVIAGRRNRRRMKNQHYIIMKEQEKKDVEYQEQLWYQANYDDLTGIYNKFGFVKHTEKMLQKNPSQVYAFFRINISGFKMLNEIYGFKRGDEVLIQFAEKLKKEVGEKGTYGRLYSDHFVVCYPPEQSKIKRELNRNTLYLECGGRNIRVQTEIGVYINTQHEQNIQVMIDYAQIALQNENASEDHFYFFKDEYLKNMLKNEQITKYGGGTFSATI